jgi:hypothetical protein
LILCFALHTRIHLFLCSFTDHPKTLQHPTTKPKPKKRSGADLFYGRVTPARHFDSLEADFSYGLLIAGLAALAVGTAFVRHMAARSALKAKWQ